MIPFDLDTKVKHGLKRVGKRFVFSINGVNPEDAGLYQLEVDGIKIFSTELKSRFMQKANCFHTKCFWQYVLRLLLFDLIINHKFKLYL